ncbi:MAG TPA: C40 family peptidase [Candidatus Kapabacteria bacterium]|nr:C40 family peptidase [Candidatus Kapabacteria bacterium]
MLKILLLLGVSFVLFSCTSAIRYSSNANLGTANRISTNNSTTSNIELPESDLRRKIINEAKNWIGTPYQYGGESMQGVDCSGFVMSVYHNVGLDMPRTSDQQFNYANKVSKRNREAGDLIFFEKNNRIFHVGIYIGSNSMIHASTSKGVIIQSLDDAYFKERYNSSGSIIK